MVDEKRWRNRNPVKVITCSRMNFFVHRVMMEVLRVWFLFSFRRNWKRRWFVLKDETLTYYENDQEGAKALGVIDVRKAS